MKILAVKRSIILWFWKLLKNWFHIPFCDGVEGPCFHFGKKRRRNTQYYKDELNWVFLCDDCMKIEHEYWKEMWTEYYSMIYD